MMLNSRSLGKKIAEARKKNQLSQAELAQKVSISPQAVGKWERGESMPDIATLNRLAEILGVDLNYFSESFQPAEQGTVSTEPSGSRQDETSQSPVSRKNFGLNWDMSQGNWADADFSGLRNLKEKFSSSNMKNCKFISADLSGLILAKNNIEHCDFTSADLRDSKIQSSNLLSDQFVHCSFIDAEFYKSNIGKCDFSQADLSGAAFSDVNFEKNSMKDVALKFTSFKRSNISDVIFEGEIEDCHFEHCSFYNVKFQNVTFRNTFFKYNKRFKKVEFIGCRADKLSYAFLKSNEANLDGITIL